MLLENGIDPTEYARHEAPRKRRSRWSADRRLRDRRGRALVGRERSDVLIRSTQRSFRAASTRLVIVGEGGERANSEQLARELNVDGPRAARGLAAGRSRYFEAMDVFASSSAAKDFLPNVLLEAMAPEVPIVSTRASTASAPRSGRPHGFLVNAGDRAGSLTGAWAYSRTRAARCFRTGVGTVRDAVQLRDANAAPQAALRRTA